MPRTDDRLILASRSETQLKGEYKQIYALYNERTKNEDG